MNPRNVNVRVLLLDDHPGILRQVAALLPAGFEVVAALDDATALATAMEKHKPDIVVLDISLPGTSGIDLAAQLRRSHPLVKLVFLTVHDDADYARAGFAAGGDGYVIKARLGTDLSRALEAAMAGRRFISKGAAQDGLKDEAWLNADSSHKHN